MRAIGNGRAHFFVRRAADKVSRDQADAEHFQRSIFVLGDEPMLRSTRYRTVNFWVILLVLELVVAAALIWIGTNAILHGRGLGREAAITIANLRRALRSVYDETVREALPNEFVELLGKLRGRQAAKGRETASA